MKTRRHIYLDDALFRQLDRLVVRPGTSQSAIIEAALRAYLHNQGAQEVDTVLKSRLEKFSNQLGRIERDIGIVMESLALFVRFQLMVTAPLPEADQAVARALAQDRFDEFVTSVGRRLATTKNFRAELLARIGEQGGQS